MDQCISMLAQHKNFLFLHKSEKFILDYMNMLSHYEFGLNHKPALLSVFKPTYDPDNINYWLEYWIMIYSNILKNFGHKDLIFLSFETLIKFPEQVIKNILINLKIININSKSLKNQIKNIQKKKFDHLQINKNVLVNADNLYKEMKIKEIKL